MSGGAGRANALALAYKADLMGRKLAAATIARRLAALRSMVKLARRAHAGGWGAAACPGRSKWKALGRNPTATRPARDRRLAEILAAATLAAGGTPLAVASPRGRRNLASSSLPDLGLRRGEAVVLDLADVDLPTFTIHIVGKGKTEPARVTLSRPAGAALADWITRGGRTGTGIHPARSRRRGADRLTGDAVARLVKALGRKAGLAREVRPHGLRHEAITRALDLCAATFAASVTSPGMQRSRSFTLR